jgi:hypothetical protein
MDFGTENEHGKTYALLTIPKSQLMRLHHNQMEVA